MTAEALSHFPASGTDDSNIEGYISVYAAVETHVVADHSAKEEVELLTLQIFVAVQMKASSWPLLAKNADIPTVSMFSANLASFHGEHD